MYETSVQEYIDYMQELEKKDPDCEEQNAAQCPRSFGKSIQNKEKAFFFLDFPVLKLLCDFLFHLTSNHKLHTCGQML